MSKIKCENIIKTLNGGAAWTTTGCKYSVRRAHGPRIVKLDLCRNCKQIRKDTKGQVLAIFYDEMPQELTEKQYHAILAKAKGGQI